MNDRPDLNPEVIAASIDSMGWPELDQLAPQIIGRMLVAAEASGAPVGGRVSSGKPTGSAPHGDLSLVDQHRPRIEAAILDDLEDYTCGQEPRRYRAALLRAAVALWEVTHRSLRLPGSDTSSIDLAREERIVSDYEDMSPEVVAALETARGGWLTAAAVRSARRRNDRRGDTGQPTPPRDEQVAEAYRLRYEPGPDGRQRSYADIGRVLGIAPSTVLRMLKDDQQPAAE